MTARNALVLIAGEIKELPAGDTLNGAGAAANGLPTAGSTAAVLVKNSATNYDASWTLTPKGWVSLTVGQGWWDGTATVLIEGSAAIDGPQLARNIYVQGGSNLFPRSDDFGNAAWTKSNATITSDATAAPDGGLADLLVQNGATSQHFLQGPALNKAQLYTISVYAKADAETVLGICWSTDSSGANFDLSTGAVSSISAGYSAYAQDVGGGWYRCVLTSVAPGNGSPIFQLRGRSVSFAGDGASGLFLWGAQAELAPIVSPYVPTVASAIASNNALYFEGDDPNAGQTMAYHPLRCAITAALTMF